MADRLDDTRAVRAAFLRICAGDHQRGQRFGLEHYQALFPGFEASIAAEWALRDERATLPAAAPAPVPAPEPEPHPAQIGPFRILSTLGEGGMGTVYLAEQHEPVRRRVALKVIKLGMDSRQVLARFEAERQALAMMNHDNIARVLEAGTTERGQPFFVMEYVEGVPITDYCDEHRLSIAQRIALFQQACDGVQHAHQKGVIHRDLKPGNVLVTRHGEQAIPKIIDFGLARATDQQLVGRTLFTEHGQMLGTPEYMSPEQTGLDAQGIDTRTDVYSLGVLLYELLAGELPFSSAELRAAGLVEIQRKLREDLPPKPSARVSTLGALADELADRRRTSTHAWSRALRGDLDWIVLKAIAKEPSRRYESATGMARDLGRFLEHQPVLAGPPGVGYRLRKFVRRYRLQVSAAAVVLVTLIAGVIGTTWFAMSAQDQAVIADREREEAVRQRADARWQSYFGNLAAAKAALQAHELDRARGHFERCPPEHRGWEWHHLIARLDVSLATLRGHRTPVSIVCWSPDGTRIVSAGEGETICLWDAAGTLLHALVDHEGWVNAVAFSKDGTRLVSASRDNTVRVWDGATGALLRTLRGHAPTRAAAGGSEVMNEVVAASFSPDATRVVSASTDGTVRLWDAATGDLLHTLRHDDEVSAAAFSPDGTRVVSASHDGTVRLWDVAAGGVIHVLRHDRWLARAAFSPDGTRVMTQPFGGSVRLWDAATGRPLHTLAGLDTVTSVAFAPDGKRIVAGGFDGVLAEWDTATGELSCTLRAHDQRVTDVAFAPDGTRIVSASDDETVRVWDAITGQLLHTLVGHDGAVTQARFAPDGARLASASADQTVRLWDPAAGELMHLRAHEGQATAATFAPDGMLLASVGDDQTVRLWDVTTFLPLHTLRGHEARIRCARFAPDGARIVSAAEDATVRLWDVRTGQLLHVLRGHDGAVTLATFAGDGTRVVSAGEDGTVRVWDAASGEVQHVLVGHQGTVVAASFSPDGARILSCAEASVRLWNAATGELQRVLATEVGRTFAATFSADGRRLVTAGEDRIVRVWDADSGEVLQRLQDHTDTVFVAAFSADGASIVSAGADAAIRLWDVATGALRHVLRGHEGPAAASFSPDGARILSASIDKTARLWDVASGDLVLTLRGHLGKLTSASFSPDGTRIVTTAEDRGVRLWDRDPAQALPIWAVDEQLRRVAPLLVRLTAQHALAADIVAALQQDHELAPETRAVAIAWARGFGDRDAAVLDEQAWRVVDPDNDGTGDHAAALRCARAAVAQRPDSALLQRTLAWALVADGRDEDAREAMALARRFAPPDAKPAFDDQFDRLQGVLAGRRLLDALAAQRLQLAELPRSLAERTDLAAAQLAWARRTVAAGLTPRASALQDPAGGVRERAVATARAAAALAPDSPNIQCALARALAAGGFEPEARDAAARALDLARRSSQKSFGFRFLPPSPPDAAAGAGAGTRVEVLAVLGGSMAEFAGLHAGDVITAVDGQPPSQEVLQQARLSRDFFEPVAFDLRRGDRSLRVDVPVGATEPR